MSPLSSSIGGIKNLPREENLVGVDKCLLHQQRSSLSLSGAPGETASSQAPPPASLLCSRTKGKGKVGTVLKATRRGGPRRDAGSRGRSPQVRRAVPLSLSHPPASSWVLGLPSPPAFLTAQARHLSPPAASPNCSVHTLCPPGHPPAAEGR